MDVFLCLLMFVGFFAIVTSIYDEIQRGILVFGGFALFALICHTTSPGEVDYYYNPANA